MVVSMKLAGMDCLFQVKVGCSLADTYYVHNVLHIRDTYVTTRSELRKRNNENAAVLN